MITTAVSSMMSKTYWTDSAINLFHFLYYKKAVEITTFSLAAASNFTAYILCLVYIVYIEKLLHLFLNFKLKVAFVRWTWIPLKNSWSINLSSVYMHFRSQNLDPAMLRFHLNAGTNFVYVSLPLFINWDKHWKKVLAPAFAYT